MNYTAVALSVLASASLLVGGESAIAQSLNLETDEERTTSVSELAPTQNRLFHAGTPEATAEQLFTAMHRADWNTYTQLMHPEALVEFHHFLEIISQADSSGTFARLFLDMESPQAQASLTPENAFAKSMQLALPLINLAIEDGEYEILGSVREGDVAHVTFRVSLSVTVDDKNPMSFRTSEMGVVSFKRHEGEWRSLLTTDVQNMIQVLQQRLETLNSQMR